MAARHDKVDLHYTPQQLRQDLLKLARILRLDMLQMRRLLNILRFDLRFE